MPHRRHFIALFALLQPLLLQCALAAGTLRVLAWPDYADTEMVQAFEQRFDAKVIVTVVSTDDELWELGSGNAGKNFDVIAVNTAELQRYIDGHLVIPIQMGSIPNARSQLPRFRDLKSIPGIIRNNKVYALPYTYSEMGLIYNRKLVDSPPVSMRALWDPRYHNKVLLYEGSAHNFSLTALTLGYSNPFQLSDSQFNAVVKQLLSLRANAAGFYSTPAEAVEHFRDQQIALLFGNYGSQQVQMLQDAGLDIGYVIPKEGALAWLDCWALLRGSGNTDLAESWINYSLSREVGHKLTQRTGLANTQEESKLLNADDTIVWLQPVENAQKRNLFWGRILSGFNKGMF